MARLKDIVVGCVAKGIDSVGTVTVERAEWIGSALDVTYRDARGNLGGRLLYEDDAEDIEIQNENLPWSFDADGDLLRLASEAYRINLAHIFDPYLAVHTSQVEPLPHQIVAVYKEMLPKIPLRYVLADDPGAGKTIMTGLFLKELIIRGDLKRCLIVSPGSLAEQWQDELYRKFNLRFEILTKDRIEASVTGNIFTEMSFCIARLDKLARDQALQEKLKAVEWDLVVIDEAHKLSATVWGGEVKYTKRFQLGRLLSDRTRHFSMKPTEDFPKKGHTYPVACSSKIFISLVDSPQNAAA